jgi:LDH2 family malate/lactate/ureidoglycolate dehydrogenase
MAEVRFSEAELHRFAVAAMVAAGASAENAGLVADVLVAADVRGVNTHGVVRLGPYYAQPVRDHVIDGQATDTDVLDAGFALTIDANNGLGHPVSVRTMRRVIDRAASSGCALAVVRNSNHFGIAAYYALLALERGLIGIAMTNTASFAVPTFGREALLGTNPVAIAIPGAGGDAFVLDMATTTVAFGKIETARRLGKPLEPGWAVDAQGDPTTDPAQAMKGALLPLGGYGTASGGHKGYGLSVLVDLLCGALAGSAFGRARAHAGEPLAGGKVGHFFAAIDPARFGDPQRIAHDVTTLLDELRTSAPANGFARVYAPEDKERNAIAEHRAHGIPFDAPAIAGMHAVAERFGVAAPVALQSSS